MAAMAGLSGTATVTKKPTMENTTEAAVVVAGAGAAGGTNRASMMSTH